MTEAARGPGGRPRLAISLGDPCGVGPELLLRSLPALQRWADLSVFGARAGVELLPREGAPVAWAFEDGGRRLRSWSPGPGGARDVEGAAAWIDPSPDPVPGDLGLGKPSAASGRAALAGVRAAAESVMAGDADALVTLPLSKAACHLAGEAIPGHTELLQALSGASWTRMAFLSPSLTVVLHTVHQSLRSVVEGLEAGAVAETLVRTAESLSALLARGGLRVALAALNPHAGEGGAFGNEESILEEALARARTRLGDAGAPGAPPLFPSGPPPEGWRLFDTRALRHPVPPTDLEGPPRLLGPYSADSLFHRAAQGEFDVVVALYHDQGLIPIKTLEPARAVNVTLGLPFIRTSPDHGTACDKAGRWLGDPGNFLEACALAIRLAARARGAAWDADPRPGSDHGA
ncbi:MAG: 4-hydroxythreonine-4-phosphate dehydrogenase PdxA [Holophagaceae bacterium]